MSNRKISHYNPRPSASARPRFPITSLPGRRSGSFVAGGCLILVLCGGLIVAPALPAQEAAARESNSVLSASNASVEPTPVATAGRDYLIGAGDVLSVDVWKEAELSRTAPVRPDGKISLPLLNDVMAAGLTPTQLGSTITAQLRTILVNPQVTVIVTQINSRQIYVLGEVTHAGAYPLLTPVTVMQAISIAGGFTPFADVNKISVMRTEDNHQEIFRFRYKDVTNGRSPEQNIRLQPGDTIIVP
jgi:polysaccharide biosynthesis/export protein